MNIFSSTDSTSSSPSHGHHCGADDTSLSLQSSSRRGTTRHCSNPVIPRKSWMRHEPMPRTLIAGGSICSGGRLPAPALSVPSVSLSLLSPPPPPLLPPPPPPPPPPPLPPPPPPPLLLSSSHRMPPRPPLYISSARWCWQRRSCNAQWASARPSNHHRCERAGGCGRGGQPRAANVAVWATATVPAIVARRNHRRTLDASVLLRHCRHYFFVVGVQCDDALLGGGRRQCPGLSPSESR